MLALNKVLQKVGKEPDTCFIWVKYNLSGAISVLPTKQANAGSLILRLSNLLIQTVKTINSTIVRVEILVYWQQLKVYKMLFESYLGERKIELLKQEVKLFIGI